MTVRCANLSLVKTVARVERLAVSEDSFATAGLVTRVSPVEWLERGVTQAHALMVDVLTHVTQALNVSAPWDSQETDASKVNIYLSLISFFRVTVYTIANL